VQVRSLEDETEIRGCHIILTEEIIYLRHVVSFSQPAPHVPVSQRSLCQSMSENERIEEKKRRYTPTLESALVITSCDISTLFCRRSEIIRLVYLGDPVLEEVP